MNYSSLAFLAVFPVFFVIYWALRSQRSRLLALVLASLLFYAYGEPAGVPILLAVIAMACTSGLLIARSASRTTAVVAGVVFLLLANLAYFKYSAFLAQMLPAFALLPPAPFLPLGISFFTFEAIAYAMDLKRGVTQVERSPVRLSLFVAVFPHLISGPIMRPNEILPQLKARIVWRWPVFVSGLELFVEGLVKKRLIGDTVGAIVDPIFAAPGVAGTPAAWLAALGYTVQIYGDFAGYTDMGRGVARMLGLELPLNFAAPYSARSITEFWQRWHMSLSRWLRDYLYVSLGGNRKGALRTYANLMLTMLLGGLWHGAGWTFVVWGGYHGALLALERRFPQVKGVPAWLGVGVTLLLVVNGWVLFRAHDFGTAVEMFRAMYLPRAGAAVGLRDAAIVLAALGVTVGAMLVHRANPTMFDRLREPTPIRGAIYAAVALACIVVVPTAVKPFIYFRF